MVWSGRTSKLFGLIALAYLKKQGEAFNTFPTININNKPLTRKIDSTDRVFGLVGNPMASKTASSTGSSSTRLYERKAGVSSPEELKEFVEKAGEKLLVVDVRNPDAEVEPGDQKSLAVAALPSDGNRPLAQHLIWDRTTDSMPLPDVEKDTPIITHCGGGGRGQLAKDFLMENGFTNVLNGGGPKETDCWNEFGDK